MKIGGRLVYANRVKEGFAIRLESVVTEPKIAGISQVAETKEHDVRPLRGSGEFVGPTAAELVRLIYPTRVMPILGPHLQQTLGVRLLVNRVDAESAHQILEAITSV